MARLKVRYLVSKPGAKGTRYFWQPAGALRELGWEPERLPDDRVAAIARAEALNAQLDAWRTGAPLPPADDTKPVKTPPRGPQPGTISDLIRRYRASRHYPAHPKTRRGYDQNIRVIEAWAGDTPVQAVTPKRIERLYASLRVNTPSKANAVVTMLRMLLKHAIREEMIRSHPALEADPGLEAVPSTAQLWPIDAISMFVEVSDRMGWHSIGTSIVINHWIGQRQGDILTMKRQAYRGGVFHVRQRKTDARVSVPHSPWVQRRVDTEIARQDQRRNRDGQDKIVSTPQAELLLCETTGRPWKEDHFRHIFAEIRAAAAQEWGTFFLDDGSTVDMLELQFLHLRHTAVTELAIAGCTTLQIAGITGHTPKSVETILTRYLVRTSALAASATAKRLEFGNQIAALVEIGDDENGSKEQAKND